MRPDSGLIGRLKGVELGEQPLPYLFGLIGRQNRLRRAALEWLAPEPRWHPQAISNGMAVHRSPIRPGRAIGAGFRGGAEIRRIKVIFACDPDQGEKGIAPSVG